MSWEADCRTRSTCWNIASASVRGSSHIRHGVECQDAHRVGLTKDGVLVIVVSDGAGSASHARWGAEIAVTHAYGYLTGMAGVTANHDTYELAEVVEHAMMFVHQSITDRATFLSLPVSSFHSTLTCVVVSSAGVIVGKIGDGVVVGSSDTYGLRTLLKPEIGEYVNSTYFITQLGVHPGTIVADTVVPESIAVSTDGLLEVAFDQPYSACIPWERFFGPLFTWVSGSGDLYDRNAMVADFLRSDLIRERCDDDLTLVLVTRVECQSNVESTTEMAERRSEFPEEAFDEMLPDERAQPIDAGPPPVGASNDRNHVHG